MATLHTNDGIKWRVCVEEEVAAPAERVWRIVSAFCNAQAWSPSLERCERVEGREGEAGCVRYCVGKTVFPGQQQRRTRQQPRLQLRRDGRDEALIYEGQLRKEPQQRIIDEVRDGKTPVETEIRDDDAVDDSVDGMTNGRDSKTSSAETAPPFSWSRERLLRFDPAALTYSYDILDSNLGLRGYVASVHVGGCDPSTCTITLEAAMEPDPTTSEAELMQLLRAVFRRNIAKLRQLVAFAPAPPPPPNFH